jgi:hypothetical protein
VRKKNKSEFEKKDRLNIIKEVFKIGIEEKRKELALESYKKRGCIT